MIIGVGTDLCSIPRMKRATASAHFVERIFSADEIEYASGKVSPEASYAVCFAAREAFCKASGVSMYEAVFSCGVSVVRAENGCPAIKISQEIAEKIGNVSIHLSTSHEGDIAAAFVVIER